MSDIAKQNAAKTALEFVSDGMRLGIGTGSTAEHFIRLLGQRVKDGFSVIGVATSEKSSELCRNVGISLTTLDDFPELDLAIDGTDEFDQSLNLIKGGGGALLREKIVAASAKRFVVIADKSKQVDALGAFPLPIEIIPMAQQPVLMRLSKMGVTAFVRQTPDGSPFQTDEGHWIIDGHFGASISHPTELGQVLSGWPGVVEHGLFCNMADQVIVGTDNDVSLISHQTC